MTISDICTDLNTKLLNYFNYHLEHSSPLSKIEESFPSFIQNTSIETFSSLLQRVDDEFSKSTLRKQHYNIKDIKTRTIITTIGTITFKRRYYQHKKTKHYFFYIDDLLKVIPYKRCTPLVEANIIYNLVKDPSTTYRQAAKPFGLSKCFVYNLLKKIDINMDLQDLSSPLNTNFLYVQADEEHIPLQRKTNKSRKEPRNYQLKEVTIFTGKDKIGKNRYQLLNKVIITPLYKESNQDFYQRIMDYIQRNYHHYSDIYCYGDGANWIKELAKQLDAKYILDKFHFNQALIRATGGSKYSNIITKLISFAQKNNIVEFNNLLLQHMKENKRNKAYQISAYQFLISNWKALQLNYSLSHHTGCSAEGINSHYFAAYFSSRPKGFSIQNIHTIGFLRALHYSGFKVIDFYLKERIHINTEVIDYHLSSKYLNNKNFIKYLDLNYSLPALHSKNSGTGALLKKIIS